jgi:ferredoxin-type protein NapF
MPKNTTDMTDFNPSRRQLLLGNRGESVEVKATANAIYPPWAVELENQCTSCGDCINHCPENILISNPTSGFPEIDFSQGECTFCQKCTTVCTANVFDLQQQPWELVVEIDDSCLLSKRIYCRSCGDACPERAIQFSLQLHNKTDIVIDAERCTGCGGCVAPCPADAVHITNFATVDNQSFVERSVATSTVGVESHV